MDLEHRYFFDFWTDDLLIPDEEGMLFADIKDVQAEAAASLNDLAREVSRAGHKWSKIAIEVRDENGFLFAVTSTYQ